MEQLRLTVKQSHYSFHDQPSQSSEVMPDAKQTLQKCQYNNKKSMIDIYPHTKKQREITFKKGPL